MRSCDPLSAKTFMWYFRSSALRPLLTLPCSPASEPPATLHTTAPGMLQGSPRGSWKILCSVNPNALATALWWSPPCYITVSEPEPCPHPSTQHLSEEAHMSCISGSQAVPEPWVQCCPLSTRASVGPTAAHSAIALQALAWFSLPLHSSESPDAIKGKTFPFQRC